jgi:hypothetical protein
MIYRLIYLPDLPLDKNYLQRYSGAPVETEKHMTLTGIWFDYGF